MKTIPLVNIAMVVYNQGKYVSRAIESVLMQKTSFPYQLIIGDDCSTDDTFEICKKYAIQFPEKILLLENKINVGLVKNYKNVFEACTAKYIAILEGDDYWIDSAKLQKQVDIMESDTSIGLVHASTYMQYEYFDNKVTSQSRKIIAKNKILQGDVFNELLKNNFIVALTAMFRRRLLEEKIDFRYFINNNYQTIDYAIWLEISRHAKIRYLEDIVGVYRIRKTSISNQLSIADQEKFLLTAKKIVNYYISEHQVNDITSSELNKSINEMLFSNSLFWGDYISSEYYGRTTEINSIKIVVKKLISRFKLMVYMYSLVAQLFFRMKISLSNMYMHKHFDSIILILVLLF